MNNITIIGRLGGDPERRGKRVSWSLADQLSKDRVQWIRCYAFGRPAEIVERYARRGSQVACAGRLQIDRGDDGETWVSVVVERVSLVGSRPAGRDREEIGKRDGWRRQGTRRQRGEPAYGDDLEAREHRQVKEEDEEIPF